MSRTPRSRSVIALGGNNLPPASQTRRRQASTTQVGLNAAPVFIGVSGPMPTGDMRFEVQRWEEGGWTHECYTATDAEGRQRGQQLRNFGTRWKLRVLSVRQNHLPGRQARPSSNSTSGRPRNQESQSFSRITGYGAPTPIRPANAPNAYQQSDVELELVEIITARCLEIGRAKPGGLTGMREHELQLHLDRVTTVASGGGSEDAIEPDAKPAN